MKRTYITLLLAAVAMCTFAAAPNGTGTYYQNANGKKGAQLKTAMCHILFDSRYNPALSYGDLWDAFYTTDVRDGGENKLWDMYSNHTPYLTLGTNQDTGSGGNEEGKYYNREHSFPQSWFGGEKSPMYTDLHHIYPTDKCVNGKRANYPFGETSSPTYSSEGGFSKLGPCSYSGYNGTVFEPNDMYKGDFARTYFYMVTCYEQQLSSWVSSYGSTTDVDEVLDGNTYPGLTTWQKNMLLEWATNDPVSDKEVARNKAVYTLQGNRNPFIDYPGLEQYIWGTKTDVAFDYDDYDGSGSGGDPDPGDSNYFTKITSIDDLESGGTYLIVYENGSKAFNGALTTLDATDNNISVTISDHKIEATQTVMASTFTITAKTGGYSVKSASGYYIGNTSKSNALKSSTSDSYTNNIAFNVQGNVYIQSSSTYLYFNSSVSQSRFRYFTSSQQDIQLYKLVESTNPSLTPSNLALTNAPIALSFDLYNDSNVKTISYTTSSTGNVTVSGGTGYVTTSVNQSTKTITVTPVAKTTSAQTITVSQEADETYEAGEVTFTVTVDDSTPAASSLYEWVETSIGDLTGGSVFVIVGTNSTGSFALPNDGRSDAAPPAIPVTVANGKITSDVPENLMWNKSGSTSSLTFYPNGTTSVWLYCTNNNNGVRIGTNSNKTFKIVGGYLQNIGTSRYLGIYNSQDWRCYQLNNGEIQANIANQTFKFYRRVRASQTISVGDTGYATMVAEADLVVPNGVEVFAAQHTAGSAYVHLEPVADGIPQGEAVVVKASEGTYDFLYATEPVSEIAGNDLKAATSNISADGTQYCLASKTLGIGFYKVQAGVTIRKGKAYLLLSSGNNVKEFYGFEDDDPTGINEELKMKNEESSIYNLAGQRLSKPQRGLNIIGGRKVLR